MRMRLVRTAQASALPVAARGVQYTGFIDVVDLSVFLLSHGLKRAQPLGLASRIRSLFRPDVEHQAQYAINAGGTDPFHWINTSNSLSEVSHGWAS